jgi:dipeptidyl aminopeptidase/acylaminoacyl peptidase
MMRRHVIAIAGLVLSALTTVAVRADTRPFTVHDLVSMQRIADPQVSPDGSRVAFEATTMDVVANRGRKDVWLAAVDGSGVRRLTSHPENDWHPRWIDDHTLYFLSDRGGSAQVWRLDLTGGEALPVTELPLEVQALGVVQGGGALIVALAVFPDCEGSIPCTTGRLAERAARGASGMVFDRLFVRHWDTWEDGRRNHLFRVLLDDDGLPVGDPVDLMNGIDGDCPTLPFGDANDFTMSPDGRWLVYTAKVVNGSEEAWSTDTDLWAVPIDGSVPPHCLTGDNPSSDGGPVFSPDGGTLAYLAMARPGYESDRRRVVLLDWNTRSTRVLGDGWDRSPSSLAWSADGSALYAPAANIGNTSIFRIDATTCSVSPMVTYHTNDQPRPLPDGSLLFAQDSLVSPVELYTVAEPGADPVQLTHLNQDRLAELEFGEVTQFSFVGAHSDQVFGYLIYPVDFDPTKRYPLAFLVHGGPQGSFDDHWHYRWHPQISSGHGYATVMIDFHGSTGYGQAFTDAIRGDWGGAPFEDLMKGLDDVLRRHRWIDPERLVAAGASYGGYMINWIQGNTDRFSALVCHDGDLDTFMAYFDTAELWFPEWEHGGTPWDNPEGYRKHSPSNLVRSWSTPQLVIHGANDFRVVDTQGLATFNALQRRGIPSRLLYYPDENHWVLKPVNSIQWHDVVLDWMDRWVKPEGESPD